MRLLLSLLFVFFVLKAALADYEYAICSLVPVEGASSTFTGYVTLLKQSGELTFAPNIKAVGFDDGDYGVTINRYGYPVSNLGGVYNPSESQQGCPDSSTYRVGDLYDINVYQGVSTLSSSLAKPVLSGDDSIIGRSLVFYSKSICPIVSLVGFNKLENAQDLVRATAVPEVVATCVISYANGTNVENLTGVNVASASTTETANGVAVLYTTAKANSTTINGLVSFVKTTDGVEILSGINGLTNEAHGFHIHAFGQFSDDGTALGGHWANSTQTHSLPTANSGNRHFGDLGNICQFDAAFENAYYNFTTNYFTINDLFGHGFAVHATRDLGTSNVGGARILQGVIAMVDPSVEIPSSIKPTTENFKFDNICENGAQDGETQDSSDSQDSSSSKLISSLFVLLLSVFVLLN